MGKHVALCRGQQGGGGVGVDGRGQGAGGGRGFGQGVEDRGLAGLAMGDQPVQPRGGGGYRRAMAGMKRLPAARARVPGGCERWSGRVG